MPASVPCTFSRFQYNMNNTAGPNAEPKPAHAKPTKSRIELLGFTANNPATTDTTITAVRDRLIITSWLGCFFFTILKISSISDVDDTKSCDEIVDMIAANTAVKIRPPISGWNKIRAISKNTDSYLLVSVIAKSGFWPKNAVPMIAINTAPMIEINIQLMPIIRPVRASFGVRNAMNRTIICGWPKYPSPHAILPISVAAETPLISEKYWGLPSACGPYEFDVAHVHIDDGSSRYNSAITGTITKEQNIIMPCTASVYDTAKNPPIKV